MAYSTVHVGMDIPDFLSVCQRTLVMGKVTYNLVSWCLWEEGLSSLSVFYQLCMYVFSGRYIPVVLIRSSEEPTVEVLLLFPKSAACLRPACPQQSISLVGY